MLTSHPSAGMKSALKREHVAWVYLVHFKK